MRTNQRLFHSIARENTRTLDLIAVGVVLCDRSGTIRSINSEASRLLDINNHASVLPRLTRLLGMKKDDLQPLLNRERTYTISRRRKKKHLHVEVRNEGEQFVVTLRNVTRQIENEAHLTKLATTDELTGCANRRHILHVLSRELMRVERYHTPLSVALIDVDRFKIINDSFGHIVGDKVIQELTKRVRGMLREIDHFGRLGGDEFIIVFPATTTSKAKSAVERIRNEFSSRPMHIEDNIIPVTISAGLASCQSATTKSDLLSQADIALYEAKEERNSVASH